MSQTITVPTVRTSTGFVAVQTYSYDSLNRLKDATENITPNGGSQVQSWKQTFTFDRYGNRRFDFSNNNTTMPLSSCSEAICNPTISTSNNWLTSTGWSYDSSGNTTGDPYGRTFIYDGENKQVKVLDSQQATIGEYFYDGDGKRVRKYVHDTGEYTIFVYDTAGKLVAEYSTQVASSQDAKVAYLTADHLGSPRINTDTNGTVTARHDYQPFGEEISTSQRVNGVGYADDTVRKQFTGYERDIEINLDFAQARYYNSQHGRFTSVDPVTLTVERLTDPQQINLYGYCRNSPYTFVDPTGEIISYADKEARKKFDEYVEFLNKDKDKYKSELATIDRLKNSEVDYQLGVGGKDFEGAEGNLTTDGNKVFVSISNVGGPGGETFSLNSRFTHELEHARQFDNGEIAFFKDAKTGEWKPSPTSYDIGDEVNAWKAQQNTSISSDYWRRDGGGQKPSLLRDFANAQTDDERAGVLARSAYPNRNQRRDSNVVFGSEKGYKPGQLIRANDFFGRVNRVVERPK